MPAGLSRGILLPSTLECWVSILACLCKVEFPLCPAAKLMANLCSLASSWFVSSKDHRGEGPHGESWANTCCRRLISSRNSRRLRQGTVVSAISVVDINILPCGACGQQNELRTSTRAGLSPATCFAQHWGQNVNRRHSCLSLSLKS